jgi:hypothetical protein
MAECGRGSLIALPALGSFCSTQVNLTMPAKALSRGDRQFFQINERQIPGIGIVSTKRSLRTDALAAMRSISSLHLPSARASRSSTG